MRVRKSASAKIREEFATALQKIADDFRVDDLADKKKAEELLRLVETNPSRFLPRLRLLIDSAPDELLLQRGSHSNGWGVRRKLVWACEHLAPFPEFFYDVEPILLKLAVLETEPKIGNNATAIWSQLFRLYLPGTAVPFTERVALLKKRFQDKSEQVALLAVRAIEGNFSWSVTRMGGPAVVAGRIPPADWHPKDLNEERERFSELLELLGDALRDSRKNVSEYAIHLFLRNIRFLLARGFYEFVRQATNRSHLQTTHLPQILDQIEDFLKFDAPQLSATYVQSIESWKSSLLPKDDLFGKLEVLIGSSHRWEYEEPERQALHREIAALARELIEKDALSETTLDWLTSEKAIHAFEFGADLGRLDQSLRLFEPIKNRSSRSNSALIRGYIFGIGDKRRTLPPNIVHWLDSLELDDPQLLYAIASSIPLQVNGFDRVMRLFEDKKIPPLYLNGLQFRIGTQNFSLEHLSRMLQALVAYTGDDRQQALATAIDVAASWVEDRRADQKSVMSDSNVWRLIRSIIDQAMPEGTMDVYHWSKLLRAASAAEPALVIKKCVEALSENLYLSEQATGILIELARSMPELVMAELGRLILNEESGWKLQIKGFRGLLSALPDEVVVTWLNQHGVDAARKIASSLPRPFLSPEGEPKVPALTQRVLELFGNDEKVRQRFAAQAGFRSYSGDIVGQHLEEARFAEKFLNYPLEPVRLWAQVERQSSLAEAEHWKQQIAEERW